MAVRLLPLLPREEFRQLKLILHSELRRRAASRRALPCPSSNVTDFFSLRRLFLSRRQTQYCSRASTKHLTHVSSVMSTDCKRGGMGARAPKIRENVFSGNYYVKFWHFSGKYHKKWCILIIFEQESSKIRAFC